MHIHGCTDGHRLEWLMLSFQSVLGNYEDLTTSLRLRQEATKGKILPRGASSFFWNDICQFSLNHFRLHVSETLVVVPRWVNAQLALDSATHSRPVEYIGPGIVSCGPPKLVEKWPSNSCRRALFCHAWDLMSGRNFKVPQIWWLIIILVLELTSMPRDHGVWCLDPDMRDQYSDPMNSPCFQRRFMYSTLNGFPLGIVFHIDLLLFSGGYQKKTQLFSNTFCWYLPHNIQFLLVAYLGYGSKLATPQWFDA